MKLILIWIFMAIYYVEGFRRRRRRRRSPPPPPPRPCQVGPWSSWSRCSHQCGNTGIQSRTRGKTVTECCGGRCPYHFRETRPCNRNACRNGGRPTNGRCNCNAGWTGTCCERDVDECLRRPCQHKCHNVPGSYTCSCNSCYTKVGTKCELRQCRISGSCYSYGSVNPRNQCKDCQKSQKTSWSNNDNLSCSDGNLCTRNDRCIKGVCTGNSFTCRSCERCDGSSCKIKSGFCVIDGKCYSHGDLRSGKPCQQCNSNNPKRWTANNNLKCSDGNVKTRNDRCVNGECSGTPFTCLSCQDHYNDACKLKSGYCVIKNAQNVDSCYRAKVAKPGNSCQWCEPNVTTFAWTNRNGVSCDDGQKCTRQDKCKSGQCQGVSFKCNTLCQYCNGNGCSLKQGFGFVNGKCTCKIAGRDYSHQQVNPSNQCQWCNLYDKASKRSLTWSNKPSVSCNDGNACTKQDVCQTGRCIGESYSCQQIYPKASCIKRSECIGDGTCRDIMRDRDTICRSPVDRCDQPERCDGVLGTCPLRSIDVITHKRGEVMLTSLDFASSLSYQATTDKFHLKITGFSVNCGTLTLKWSLLKGQESCSARNVSGTLPSTSNQILSGLSLKNGETYKILLQSYDMRNKVKQTVCSNVVTIDTTKPSGGWVRDGLGTKDIQYQSSKKVSATWGGFTTTHGIKKYEVAVYYKSKTLTSFINVNLNASFSKTISTLRDGSQIIIKVRAFTKAGLYSEVSSNGVIVDTSKPKAGIISDGLSIDKKYANWTTTYEANWQPYADNDSPITEYKIGVKRKNGALVSSGLISVGRQLKGKVTGLSLTSGIEYCALVKGINAAGLSTQATSNCVLIDHIAPQPGVVNDGASDDIDYQSADNVFRANWKGFTDGKNGSGIMEYMHKITDNSGRQITNWFSVGLQTKATITGLNLVDGRSYFITVKAIDKVGHFVEVRSDGIYIDISHPVYTGKLLVQGETGEKNGKRVIYLRNNNSLSVSWPQFLDEQSGMLKYQWSIVEVNSTVTTWSDVPGVKLSTKAVLSSLSLENNKEYRLTIRGLNNAGLYSDIKSSVLIPQSEAPQEGNVLDGEDPNVDIDYQTNSSMIQATWYGFDTPNVKVRKYYIAVGSCIEGNYHVTNNGFVAVHPMTATSFEFHDLSLVNGQKYCIKVKAENLAGVETKPVSSDGFIVDTSPPDLSHAMVLDGSGEDDVDFQSSTTEISFTWSGIKDPDSGIEHFEVAISRNRIGQPDVTSYINVGQNTSASLSGLRLSNKVYYVIVCAFNMAGLRSCTSSDGVLVDPTPSTVGFVYDGLLAPDINYQSSLTKMSANWERIWDLESRIERFEWAIVDNYQNMVMKFVDVGLQTHVTTEKALKLMHNRTYIVYLRVYNRAGGLRELHSNGVTIDTTSPIPTDIVLGAGWRFDQKTGNYYSSSATGINVTWGNYKEFESELWYHKWGIGTSKCGTQTQQLINIGLSTSANTSQNELVFQQGIHYYVTVVARNRANLVSQSCTPGLIFDYSPPQIGRIHIKSETRHDKTYFNSLKGLRITWQDFIDPESNIKLFEISLKQSNKTISKSILTASKGPFEYYLNGLSSATWYFAAVKAINYAGLETEGFSKPFIIDETMPFYTGRERGVPKKQYQSDTTSVKITWKSFDDKESPIEYYEIGIGTGQTRDNIFNFTKTGLIKEIQLTNLELLENHAYYVSVRATNAAGLSTTLYLSRIYIDKTPPFGKNTSVRDGLSMYDVNFISLNDSVSANWDAIKDEESGIEKYEYCVGTTPFNCLVKHFTSVNKNNSYVCNDCQVYADMKIYTTIKATNEAGLSAMFTSNGVRMDSTPPEIGDVLDGDVARRPDAENVEATWTPAVTWYGVRDIQSGIQGCEWIILRKGEDIPIFKKRLNSTSYDNRHTERLIVPIQNTNASYVNLIRCTNNAGMVSERTSNGWSVVEEWPVILYVHDGNRPSDIDYVTEGEIIRASWKTFNGDGKDPVVSYEWAVGDIVDPKAIMEYENVGLRTQVSKSLVESDAELQSGKMYFVTVRARALSGRMSNKTSNGFMVDNSSPVPGVVKVEHKIVNQTINELDYSLNWNNFKDPESGIRVYEYCLGYVKNVCATPLTSAGLEKQATVVNFIPVDVKIPFYGIVIATNNAGLKTVVNSDVIQIDFTPPKAGKVIEGVDDDLDYINDSVALVVTWSGFNDSESGIKNCRLSMFENSDSLEPYLVLRKTVKPYGSFAYNFIIISGVKYMATVECTNNDGFVISSSSDGITRDDSPPITGQIYHGTKSVPNIQYQSSTDVLQVYWNNSKDQESGIKAYFIGVGSTPNDDNVRPFYSVGRTTKTIISNVTMKSGFKYYVTLEVVNNANLRSRVSSSGVTVDNSSPIITKTQLQSSTLSGFIGPEERLRGNWSSYDDESGIDFTEYCFGTTKGACQTQIMERTRGNDMQVTCNKCQLENAHTYFMTIRVWNKAGLFSLQTSQGVTFDMTPPKAGKVLIAKNYMSCFGNCSISGTLREFEDKETKIKSCQYKIENENGSVIYPVKETVNKNTIVAINLNLTHGKHYVVIVTCKNYLGIESKEVNSPSIIIDNTPPEKGLVIVSPNPSNDIRKEHHGCHYLNSTLRIFWHAFRDKESLIAGFKVAIGRTQFGTDIIPYQDVGITSVAKFELSKMYGLSPGEIIFATVSATNRAGLTSIVSSAPTRLLSDTEKSLLNESDFQCVNFF